jgi:hypothetical protein
MGKGESSLSFIDRYDSKLYEISVYKDKVDKKVNNIIFRAKDFGLPEINYRAGQLVVNFSSEKYMVNQIDSLNDNLLYIKELIEYIEKNIIKNEAVH